MELVKARDLADHGKTHEDCLQCHGMPDLWRELDALTDDHRAYHVAVEARLQYDRDTEPLRRRRNQRRRD
jgi:hypothetical protein